MDGHCRLPELQHPAIGSVCRASESPTFAVHRPIDQLQYPAGATIYQAGDEGTSLFTVRTGLVKLSHYLPDGSQRIVRLLRKTDVLGLEC